MGFYLSKMCGKLFVVGDTGAASNRWVLLRFLLFLSPRMEGEKCLAEKFGCFCDLSSEWGLILGNPFEWLTYEIVCLALVNCWLLLSKMTDPSVINLIGLFVNTDFSVCEAFLWFWKIRCFGAVESRMDRFGGPRDSCRDYHVVLGKWP